MASNIEVASYDPKKVNLVMNGKIITGFASDSMITIARNEDTVTTQVGVKGDVACTGRSAQDHQRLPLHSA